MIEFTTDGPFGKKIQTLFPSRVRVVGLGLTGTAVCDQLILHSRTEHEIWVVDSDQQGIEGSVVRQKIYIGGEFTRGLGCNGDFTLAREVVAGESPCLERLTENCDFLILVVGLSGATGLAVAEALSQRARREECKVVAIGVQPFAFEGRNRKQQASQAIALLRRECDSVLILAHDRLANDPSVRRNVRVGFHLMHQQLAKAVESVAQVVCKRGLIQLSFADLRSLYGRYSSTEVLENCWLSSVEGDIEDDSETLVHDLLAGPLLQDATAWRQVDHALVTVSGSRDLSLADVQNLVNLLRESLPVPVPLSTSAHLEEPLSRRVGLTLLLAKTAAAPSVPAEELYRPGYEEERPLRETQEMPFWALPHKTSPPASHPGSAGSSAENQKKTAGPEETKPSGLPLGQEEPPPFSPSSANVPCSPYSGSSLPGSSLPESLLHGSPFPEFSLSESSPSGCSPASPSLTESSRVPVAGLNDNIGEDTPSLPEVQAEGPAAYSQGLTAPSSLSSSACPPREDDRAPGYQDKSERDDGLEAAPRKPRKRTSHSPSAKQEEIRFEPVSRGRFEKSDETFYRGEDLDLPTFRRRGLQIKV